MSKRSAKEEALLREIAKVSALLNHHKASQAAVPPRAVPNPSKSIFQPPTVSNPNVPPPGRGSRVWVNPEAAQPKPTQPSAVSSSSTSLTPAASKAPPIPKDTRKVVLSPSLESQKPSTLPPPKSQFTFRREPESASEKKTLAAPAGVTVTEIDASVKITNNEVKVSSNALMPPPKAPGLLQRRLSATIATSPAPFRKSRYSLVMNRTPTPSKSRTAVSPKASVGKTKTDASPSTTRISRFKLRRVDETVALAQTGATSTSSSLSQNAPRTPTISQKPSLLSRRLSAQGSPFSRLTTRYSRSSALPLSLGPRKSSTQRHLANHALQLVWDRKKEEKKKQPCVFFTRFGRCKSGDKCPYMHDKTKVAICRKFLRGKCTDEACPLQHVIDKDKMPICFFFNSSPDGSGCKLGDQCPYLHVRVSPDADVCPDFVQFGGYCPRGTQCPMKHTDECQAYAQFGECPLGDKCKMRHRDKKKHKKKQQEAEGAEAVADSETSSVVQATNSENVSSVGREDDSKNEKKRKRVPNFSDQPPLERPSESAGGIDATDLKSTSHDNENDKGMEESKTKRIRPNFL